MSAAGRRPVLIAGGGVAGLTAALAFARLGVPSRLFERHASFREIGAGLQLSPNATCILEGLGVLDELMPLAVRPPSIRMRDARTFREIARFPLGDWAEKRWGAPYLVAHRADLQRALLRTAEKLPDIEIATGATVAALRQDHDGVAAQMETGETVSGRLGVVADGVWSTLRPAGAERGRARFAGQIAWRCVVEAGGAADALVPDHSVGAYLSPGFHVVAYPIAGGAQINVVAFTEGRSIAEDWSARADPAPLLRHLRGAAPALARLASEPERWSAFPLHVAPEGARWIEGHIAALGDAAHAMTPFAAQGAAMAIEDSWCLARAVAGATNVPDALRKWEADRRTRVTRVRQRGAFNKLVWHAAGPIALARDIALRFARPERLAADLDWLYGYRAA